MEESPQISQEVFDLNPHLLLVEFRSHVGLIYHKFRRHTVYGGTLHHTIEEVDQNDKSHLEEWLRYSRVDHETQL